MHSCRPRCSPVRGSRCDARIDGGVNCLLLPRETRRVALSIGRASGTGGSAPDE